MTIKNMLELFRKDDELRQLIQNSPEAMGSYRPRNYPGRRVQGTETTIAVQHFWSSLSGIKFRFLAEEKYGLERRTRGYKDAVSLFILEVRRNAGIND